MIHIRIEPRYDSDVVVVGAGPAGASAAVHLARSGLRVILIDSKKFPRDKVCGDFLGPLALMHLQDLGVSEMAGLKGTNIIRRAALHMNGRRLICTSLPQVGNLPPYGRVIPRLILDKWIVDLARASGAQVLEGLRVKSFQSDADGVEVRTTGPQGETRIRAKVLIGADGSNSTVAKLLEDSPRINGDRIIAGRVYFEGTCGQHDQADLYFSKESFPGYCWLFPTGRSSANVGVGMVMRTVPRAKYHLRSLLLQLIENDSALGTRLFGASMEGTMDIWPLKTYNPHRKIVADRVVLVGDAAGLINPLNGEGIQHSLLSARLASVAIISCATKNVFSQEALAWYARSLEHKIRYDMALSVLIIQFIRNRDLNPLWLHMLNSIAYRARKAPDYAHTAGGILAGILPASNALTLDFISETIQQAALSFGVNTVFNIMRGPGHLRKLGTDTAVCGVEIAREAVRHPSDLLNWGFGLGTGATELAVQFMKALIKKSG